MHPGNHFLVCGNVVHDVVAQPVREPLQWSTTTLVDHLGQHLGGNASNTSYTLAKLGRAVQVLSLTGRDPSGEFVRSRLKAAGVDTSSMYFVPEPTSMALCLVNDRAERAFLYQMGASGADFPEPLVIPPGTKHFHLSAVFRMRYLRKHGPAYLRTAKERGLTTSADTQWDTEGEWMTVLRPSLPYLDLLMVNHDEARMLTGTRDPERSYRMLLEAGARQVVIKLGGDGCLVNGERIPPFAVEAIDTTGAGDCFAGAYLAALSHGFSPRRSGQFANAVGALAVQSLGAVEGVRSWHETLAWIEQHS